VVATGAFEEEFVVAVRQDGWKYINGDNGMELYDLTNDPEEQSNVVSEHPEQYKNLKEAIPSTVFKRKSQRDKENISPEAAERLRQLGYKNRI
jgi:arylsulfatase A-like enzyme